MVATIFVRRIVGSTVAKVAGVAARQANAGCRRSHALSMGGCLVPLGRCPALARGRGSRTSAVASSRASSSRCARRDGGWRCGTRGERCWSSCSARPLRGSWRRAVGRGRGWSWLRGAMIDGRGHRTRTRPPRYDSGVFRNGTFFRDSESTANDQPERNRDTNQDAVSSIPGRDGSEWAISALALFYSALTLDGSHRPQGDDNLTRRPTAGNLVTASSEKVRKFACISVAGSKCQLLEICGLALLRRFRWLRPASYGK